MPSQIQEVWLWIGQFAYQLGAPGQAPAICKNWLCWEGQSLPSQKVILNAKTITYAENFIHTNSTDLQIFSPILCVLFTYFLDVLLCTKLTNSDQVQFLYIFLRCRLCILQVPDLLLCFLLTVLTLTFRSLIFSVNFYTWCEVCDQFLSFAFGCRVFPELFIENTILSPVNCLAILVKNELTIEFYF